MGRIRWLLLLLALLLAACKRNQAPEPATFLYGHYAYVGYGTHLWVVDVTDPTGPVLVRQIGQPNQRFGQVQVVGDTLYAMAIDRQSFLGELAIFDLADPADPSPLGRLPLEASGWPLLVAGRYAYVSAFPGLKVVDVSDQATPALVGQVEVTLGSRLLQSGDRLYTAFGYCGRSTACVSQLLTISVADPARPAVEKPYDFPEPAFNFTVLPAPAENQVYVSAAPGVTLSDPTALYPLWLFDASNPANPIVTQTYQTPGVVQALAADYALALPYGRPGNLLVARRAAGGHFETAVTLATPENGFLADLNLAGGYAYLVHSLNLYDDTSPNVMLQILDLRDPARATEAARLPLGGP